MFQRIWKLLSAQNEAPVTTSPTDEGTDPIGQFWSFWSTSQRQLLAAIDDGSLSSWVNAIDERVKAIHPNLGWEFGEGRSAQHYFCISGAGNMERRLLTERWLHSGPRACDDWEFYPYKPAVADRRSVTMAGVELDFANVRFTGERAGFRLQASQ